MIQKRPFVDEDPYKVACKHPRQWENTNHFTPSVPNGSYHNPRTSDAEGLDSFSKCQDEGRSELVADISNGTSKEFETGASGCIPHFLWVNNGVIEADVNSEAAVHLSFFPEYFAPGHHLRALLQSDETYSSYLDYPPWKPVSIGPEHQADVPEWDPRGLDHLDKSGSQFAVAQSSDSGLMDDDGNGEKLMGTCVVSMPDFDSFVDECSEDRRTGIDCKCLDGGSIECVREHVMEAREKLRENLGQEIFEELGFCDMGEEVAKKWTEEEEQAFHDVVLSNPASLGRNFWDHLSAVFPSRTKKDIVSYYFNVFMLRKRAEQNRFDPLNIDSDNDEWQRSEEDDEDSVVESPTGQEVLAYNQDHAEDCHEEIEEDDEIGADVVVHRVATDEEDEGDIDDISGAYFGNSDGDCGVDTDFQLLGKIQNNNGGDYDVQDDSCTSYEYQRDKADCYGPLDIEADARQSSQE